MKTKRIINLTAHRVTVHRGKQKAVFEPSGMVARLLFEMDTIYHFEHQGVHTPVNRLVATGVKGLPPQREGVLLIVSSKVRNYLPNRRDLATPTQQIRQHGRIVGCRALLTN